MRSLVFLCLVAWLVHTQARTPASRDNQLLGTNRLRLSRSMLMTSGTFTGLNSQSAKTTVTASGDKGAAVLLIPENASTQRPQSTTAGSHSTAAITATLARRFLQSTPSTPEWAQPQIGHGKNIDDSSATVQQQDAQNQIRGLVNSNNAQLQPEWAQPQIGHGKEIDDSAATVQQQDAADQIGGLVKPGSAGVAPPDWANPQIGHGKNIGDDSSTVQQQDSADQIRGLVKTSG